MTFEAHNVLVTILDSLDQSWDLQDVLNVLEDGEALANLGFTDEDQDAIEEVHASITDFLNRNAM